MRWCVSVLLSCSVTRHLIKSEGAVSRLALMKGRRYRNPMTEGISIDPAVCHGKPVIKGTRVLVSTILGALAGGDSREEVEQDYAITPTQISAALQFASDIADFQVSAYDAVA